jgi:hypothetical protein
MGALARSREHEELGNLNLLACWDSKLEVWLLPSWTALSHRTLRWAPFEGHAELSYLSV